MDMRRALKDRIANYKIPQELKVVGELPKNAMGKGSHLTCLSKLCRLRLMHLSLIVNKKNLVKEIFGPDACGR